MTDTPDSLDVTDQMLKRRLHVLHLLTDEALWKKLVAQRLDETPQTIGRDIDALHRDGLLTYTLTDAPNHSRTHFIAFETTDEGEQALTEYHICIVCGDVVTPAEDCLHDYHPAPAAFTAGGGD